MTQKTRINPQNKDGDASTTTTQEAPADAAKANGGKCYIFRSVKQNKNMVQSLFWYNPQNVQPHDENNKTNKGESVKVWLVNIWWWNV